MTHRPDKDKPRDHRGKRQPKGKGGDQRRGDQRRRDGHEPRESRETRQHRTVTSVSSGQLPKWIREEIQRSTPKDRRDPALNHLAKALNQFADERYAAALPELRKAKTLAPRSSTVREMLGLSAYHTGNWEEALRELRTFRRLTGDLIHMPIEMDSLRALGRKNDVTKTWDLLQDLDPSATVGDEARVVYASFLLDEGKPLDAWNVIKPGRLVASPSPGELRRWYVAARVALEAGDMDAARRLVAALDEQETDFEGVDELRAALL
ncbi:MAG: tetratricopeptide repeat protein [Acidimicrobiia bacterium]